MALIGTRQAPQQARLFDLANGQTAELIAAQIGITYDPTTGTARATFFGNQYINGGTGDVPQYLKLAGTAETFAIDMAARMGKLYAPTGTHDPVTGADLSQVSIAGFMTIVKLAYNAEVNARQQAIADLDAAAADPPPAEPQT